jgi:ATP-binding cassette subfamily F protein 3
VVFVSHDRYFIDKLATRIVEVEDGKVHVYPGNYEDYLWRKQGAPGTVGGTVETPAISAPPTVAPPQPESAAGGEIAQAKGAIARLNPIKLRQMKQRRHAIEDEVTRLEVEISDYEAALANYVSVEETKRVSELLDARRSDLEALLLEWEEVAQSIEANS